MSRRLVRCRLLLLVIALTNLPVSQAQTFKVPDRNDDGRSKPIPISSYEDDPFVMESVVQRIDFSRFGVDSEGRLMLMGDQVSLAEESKIYALDKQTGEFKTFAWNPWPLYPLPNEQGDFRIVDEERFPLHKTERDAEGKVILRDGLQVWTPRNLRLGSTTAFEAAQVVKDASESWAGRDILWGDNGILSIEPHIFIDFNAFYSPSTRALFFGVVPYRLRGQTEIKIFETASSWEMVAHEAGHAVHNTIKPNRVPGDKGFTIWGESFGDQTSMWSWLRDRDRVSRLLTETGGDLNQSNALTRLVEAFAALIGKGTGVRDAFHDKKVSDTEEEVHARSEVLTGAAYKLFLTIYSRLKSEKGVEDQDALRKAGEIMGVFLVRAADYTPENIMTLEDVAKAYLKVDKEFYDGCYHTMLVDEFIRREIFDADSVSEWLAHEAAIPYLYLSQRPMDHDVEPLIQANLDRLVGPESGLKLQSVTHESRLPRRISFGQTIVRVQLTQGRGDGATPLDNHGILVFRRDGTLADYHAPLPTQGPSQQQAQTQLQEAMQLRSLLARAKRLHLDQSGAPLSIVRRPDGQWTVEARVMRGTGLNAYLEVFTLDNPRGERPEILISPLPPDKRIHISDDVLN
jgi:hypothetical protein